MKEELELVATSCGEEVTYFEFYQNDPDDTFDGYFLKESLPRPELEIPMWNGLKIQTTCDGKTWQDAKVELRRYGFYVHRDSSAIKGVRIGAHVGNMSACVSCFGVKKYYNFNDGKVRLYG